MARLDEMTQAEKQAAFENWLKSKAERKAKGTAKRQATRDLISLHNEEFQELIKKYEGKPVAKAGK